MLIFYHDCCIERSWCGEMPKIFMEIHTRVKPVHIHTARPPGPAQLRKAVR